MALCDGDECRDVGRVPENVHDQDCPGAGGDCRLNRCRVHIECEWVDLCEHRRRTGVDDDVRRGDERERGGDYLVPRADAKGMQAAVQASCAR